MKLNSKVLTWKRLGSSVVVHGLNYLIEKSYIGRLITDAHMQIGPSLGNHFNVTLLIHWAFAYQKKTFLKKIDYDQFSY